MFYFGMKISPCNFAYKINQSKNIIKPQLAFKSLGFDSVSFSTKAKNPEFKKAQTLDEAFKFGYKELGIVDYYGFDENQVDSANFINEGLYQAKQLSKTPLKMPKYIFLKDLDNVQMSMAYTNGGILKVNDHIYTNEHITDEIDRIFEELIDNDVIIIGDSFSINPVISSEKTDEFFSELMDDYSNISCARTLDEKLDIYHRFRVLYEKTSILNRFPKDLILRMVKSGCYGEFSQDEIEKFKIDLETNKNFPSLLKLFKNKDNVDLNFDFDIFKFKTFFHELGHLQNYRFVSTPLVCYFNSPKDYNPKMLEWLENEKGLKAAHEVLPYACLGAPEFIAETYANLLLDKELSSEALALYKKYNGPKVRLKKN